MASARVVEARALAGIAKSYLYPQVGVGFAVSGEQMSRLADPPASAETTPDRRYNNFGAERVAARGRVDLFGRLRRGKEAAFAQYLATEEGRRAIVVTLVGDIASTYFFLRELDLQLEIARRTLKINDDTVAYYTNRLAGRRVQPPRGGPGQGQPRRHGLDDPRHRAADRPRRERPERAPRPPARPITRGRAISEQKPPPGVPAGLPAQLLERRPDVLQAEQLLWPPTRTSARPRRSSTRPSA